MIRKKIRIPTFFDEETGKKEKSSHQRPIVDSAWHLVVNSLIVANSPKEFMKEHNRLLRVVNEVLNDEKIVFNHPEDLVEYYSDIAIELSKKRRRLVHSHATIVTHHHLSRMRIQLDNLRKEIAERGGYKKVHVHIRLLDMVSPVYCVKNYHNKDAYADWKEQRDPSFYEEVLENDGKRWSVDDYWITPEPKTKKQKKITDT